MSLVIQVCFLLLATQEFPEVPYHTSLDHTVTPNTNTDWQMTNSGVCP